MKLAAVALIALTASAQAYELDYPPAEYRYEPTKEVVINRQTLGATMRACEHITGVQTRWACHLTVGASCVLYLPERGAAVAWATLERLTEHEKAHCNVWLHPVRGKPKETKQ